jgi:hypothetical protein
MATKTELDTQTKTESRPISRPDLAIGLLVLIGGILMYEFTPHGYLFEPGMMHIISYYVGGVIAVVSGTIGLGLYKRINLTGLGVSVLSVILGFVFVLDAPTGVLYALLQPHAIAMEMTGGLTALAGLAGIAASLIVKRIGALKS